MSFDFILIRDCVYSTESQREELIFGNHGHSKGMALSREQLSPMLGKLEIGEETRGERDVSI